ncbi:Wzz/FepE/Etk N-terminal domain-containing protein [Kribbella deserti]|uniref:Wzz/FepE/Etk N-terminal domain-containing protein n=1 Tax=Kribbella deserti TaxID=1926257 RepID=A0ABV6QJY0_9ACTN
MAAKVGYRMEPGTMVWRDAVQSLWRRRLLIGACTLLGVAGAFAFALPQTARWTATSEILVGPAVPPALLDLPAGLDKTGPLGMDLPAETQARVVASPSTMRVVAARLGLSVADDEVQKMSAATRVKAVTDNSYIITTDGSSAEEAVRRANTIAGVYLEQRRAAAQSVLATLAAQNEQRATTTASQAAGLQRSIDNALSRSQDGLASSLRDKQVDLRTSSVDFKDKAKALREAADSAGSTSKLVTPASPEAVTVSPNITRDVSVGAVLGFVLGIALALGSTHLSPFVATRDEAARSAGAPVLTASTTGRRWWHRTARKLDLSELTALGTEVVSAIARRGYTEDGEGAVLVVSASPSPNADGVALAMACATAREGRRTVLVFADVRGPRPDVELGRDAPANPDGLVNLVGEPAHSRSDKARKLLVPGPAPDLQLLMPGSGDEQALTVAPALVPGIVTELRGSAEALVVHGPAADRNHGVAPLAAAVDGCVLVVQCGHDRQSRVSRLCASLEFAGAPVLGVVLIGAHRDDETLGIPVDANGHLLESVRQ